MTVLAYCIKYNKFVKMPSDRPKKVIIDDVSYSIITIFPDGKITAGWFFGFHILVPKNKVVMYHTETKTFKIINMGEVMKEISGKYFILYSNYRRKLIKYRCYSSRCIDLYEYLGTIVKKTWLW